MDWDIINRMQERIDELEKRVSYLYDKMNMGYSSEIKPSIFDPRLQEAIQKGNKIEAIKVYRELTHCDLLEAKNAVEGMWNNYH
ncbi:MAG: ribosomal protein L7/L12 [Leptolinea sp.]